MGSTCAAPSHKHTLLLPPLPQLDVTAILAAAGGTGLHSGEHDVTLSRKSGAPAGTLTIGVYYGEGAVPVAHPPPSSPVKGSAGAGSGAPAALASPAGPGAAPFPAGTLTAQVVKGEVRGCLVCA